MFTVDGKEMARKTLEHTIPLMMTIDETLDIGIDTRSPVDDSYTLPFQFTGTIDKLTYKLGPSQLAAAEQKLHDTQGIHSARFMECFVASVSMDRKANCPDTIGFQRDWSDQPMFDPENHFYTQPSLTRYGAYPA